MRGGQDGEARRGDDQGGQDHEVTGEEGGADSRPCRDTPAPARSPSQPGRGARPGPSRRGPERHLSRQTASGERQRLRAFHAAEG